MNPLGLFIIVVCSLITFAPSRKAAALAVLASVCYVTQGQMISIGFHFTAVRIVLLFAFFRVLARGELKGIGFNVMDKAVLIYVALLLTINTVAHMSSDAFVYQIGCAYNILVPYFVFRGLFWDLEDLQQFLASLAILILPLTALMLLESVRGINIFSTFGGVEFNDEFRDGHYRCSGAFRSPITGGTFGATLMPLFAGLYFSGPRHKKMAITGFAAATMITITSRSSGPLMEYVFALLGLFIWKWRAYTRQMRRGLVIGIVTLHLMMKAPVWFMLARVSDLIGGGGWHRAYLIDRAVFYFRTWWLMGTDDTSEWMPTQLSFGGADLTNAYISAGVSGGLVTMIAFIWIIVKGFSRLGLAMKKVRDVSPHEEKMLWAIGCALFATVVNFFSVSYFDQIETVWYLLVAVIASVSFDVLSQPDRVEVELVEDPEDAMPGLISSNRVRV